MNATQRMRHGCASSLLMAGVVGLWLGTGCEQAPPAQPPSAATTQPSAAAAAPARLADTAPQGGTVGQPSAPPPGTITPPPLPPLKRPTGTFLDREEPAAVRLLNYNVKWNSMFMDVDPRHAQRVARVLRAVDPDIVALQEIGVHPQDRGKPGARKRRAEEVAAVLNVVLPLPAGQTWHAFQGHSNVTAARYPLTLTRDKLVPAGERDLALALVDLPDDRFPADLYVLNNHFKCCDGEKNDPLRQQQADAIVAWLRDARTPGGEIDLPDGTPIAVVGDLNIVGGPRPLQTLLTGDILDEARYGPDLAPDWDASPLADLRPRHNLTGPEDWTWRDDNQQWPPGRLDFILYTDSVLQPVKSFVLNTTTMQPEELAAAGLERLDVCQDDQGAEYDHLPLVVDFLVGTAAPVAR